MIQFDDKWSYEICQGRQVKSYLWSDDEVELLSNITNEYKVKKVANAIDWESVKNKNSDILELLKDAFSDDEETQERNILSKDLPHKKDEIMKQVLTSKLKAICLNFVKPLTLE